MVWERREPLVVVGGPVIEGTAGFAEAAGQRLGPVSPGDHFGAPFGGWQTRWFRVDVPAAEPGEEGRRHLAWLCDGETIAWVDGEPWAGLDAPHVTCPLPDRAVTVWLETGLWSSMSPFQPLREIGAYGSRFDGCELRVRDEYAWGISIDLDVLDQLLRLLYVEDGIPWPSGAAYVPPLESCSPLLRILLQGLNDACDAWVRGGINGLGNALGELLARLPAETWQPVAALCGHAHIDLVWLWPEMATERKAIHSFATVLRLMERYPEMTFLQSQPALNRTIERHAPSMLPEIQARIDEGRWDLTGAFEVEPDTNVPSGEALARSLVVGQRKIAGLKGAPSEICWLPDVFGYSAALPQILALGGVRYFFTTKMTWSAITRFPYTSFVWRGADGSEVMAHLSTANYNGSVNLAQNTAALRTHRQAAVHPEMLLPTGWGDGGGGPSEEMLERARRVSNLAGTPTARWTTSGDFFARMDSTRERLPVYQGELYLEYHRGTLTTQSEFKRLYRAAETALQAHEATRVVTGTGPLGDEAWRRVLFCQFHDAIPGSSIGRVYEELNAELAAIVERELGAAREALASSGAGHMAFNPLPVARSAVVEVQGRLALAQMGPLGGVALNHDVAPVAAVRVEGRSALDNGIVRAAFDEHGQLAGLRVRGEDLDLDGGCSFELYHDDPAHFDAWDIDHYTFRTGVPAAALLTLEIVEDGPLRAALRGAAPLGERSTMTVTYALEAEAEHLRIEVEVDWQESHRLLKLHARTGYRGRMARYGTPFGSIERPQTAGVEADEARWEVAGSRWAAVTRDDGAGLALLAEAKYGFSCRDGDLSVSLLRAPTWPDEAADVGRHRVRLAIGRYEAQFREDSPSTAGAADALFAPVVVTRGAREITPLFAFEELGSLTPSWVLPSEAEDGYVIRLHETAGGSGTAVLRLAAAGRVEAVDFLERERGGVESEDGVVFRVGYGAYEVVSLRVMAGAHDTV
jgi:alpha-mannosidase